MRKKEDEKQFELMQRYRRTAVAVGKEKKTSFENKNEKKIETLQDIHESKKDTIGLKPIMTHIVKGGPVNVVSKFMLRFFPKKKNQNLDMKIQH